MVASDNLHHGEEPPISGTHGSGTIFLSHCSLRCRYCQNYPISHLGNGNHTTPKQLAGMMLRLQNRGAHNINFVTPSHYLVPILEAIDLAAGNGLKVPLAWNCSGYESLVALQLLDGVIDIYMPDAKFSTSDAAAHCCNAPDYPEINRAALREMYRQVGDLQIDDGLAVRGLIIRHMVLPQGLAGSREVLRFIREELSADVYIALLAQYFPAYQALEDPQLNRGITREEYSEVFDIMEEYGLETGLSQEMDGERY